MPTTHLTKQIERIAGEAPRRNVSAVVQMQTGEDLEEYLESTTEGIDTRRAVDIRVRPCSAR